jgi:hypothetical protein
MCTEATDDGYAPNYGYYYSATTKAWLQAPRCVPVWGNLALMPSQIARPGGAITMTAVPNQGSNSATYAPETKSITWDFPGKKISGCGPADLSCTTVPFAKAGPQWQWALFHVTMPRTFFIDSPGEFCAGQHVCAGFATNAWSFAGLPPAGTPGPLPLGVTRVCIGGCRRAAVVVPEKLRAGVTSVQLPVGCGGAAAKVARLRAFAAELSCPVELKATLDEKFLTELEKSQEAELRTLAERHKAMAQLQKEMLDLQNQVTENKRNTTSHRLSGDPPEPSYEYILEHGLPTFDHYIQGNAGSPEVLAMLADAEASLGGMYPPQAESASAAAARARAAQGGPSAAAILRGVYAARPTAADARAYTDALALATSATPSLDRGRARLLLSIALRIGRGVLVGDLGSKATFTIASAGARVRAGQTRTIALRATTLGGRALRILGILGLSRKVGVKLHASSTGNSATRTIYLR